MRDAAQAVGVQLCKSGRLAQRQQQQQANTGHDPQCKLDAASHTGPLHLLHTHECKKHGQTDRADAHMKMRDPCLCLNQNKLAFLSMQTWRASARIYQGCIQRSLIQAYASPDAGPACP